MTTYEQQVEHWRWARLPFVRCVDYLQELENVLHLSMRGIGALRGMFNAQKLLIETDEPRYTGKPKESDPAEIEKQLGEAKKISDLALAETQNHFPLLHAHTVVAMWGALDALVDDALVTWFLNAPKTLDKPELTRIRIPLATYESLERPDRMRVLVDELKRQTEARYKPGVAGFEELLATIDLSGPVKDDVKKTLIEMREVRNVLVHNAGIIDRRLASRCPWEQWEVGSKVVVIHDRYQGYYHASYAYVVTLINRVRKSVGFEEVEPLPAPDAQGQVEPQ